MRILGPVLLNILLVLVIFAVFALFLKVRLHINFSKHRGEEFKFETAWTVFGGKIKKSFNFKGKDKSKNRSAKKSKRKKEKKELSFREKLQWLKDTSDRIRKIQSESSLRVKKSVFFQKIHLKIYFGLDDAFLTGISTGLIWAILYNFVAILSAFFRIAEPEFEINPVYDEELFDGEGECIVSFRLVNIISALISVGINYYKTKPKQNKNESASENHKSKGGD